MITPNTSDIELTSDNHSFELHKFLLSARSPYFQKKLEAHPQTEHWKLATAIPDESFHVVLQYMYLGDVPKDLSSSRSGVSDEDILTGIDKISKQLEIEHLWEAILAGGDRRLARQRYQDEVARALGQVGHFFETKIIGHKMTVDTDQVDKVTWKCGNSIFADILLRADEPEDEEDQDQEANGLAAQPDALENPSSLHGAGIPIGPALAAPVAGRARKSVLYPAHKAMLIRSDYFQRMFSGEYVESRKDDDNKLHVVTVDCRPAVLELVLAFLYTESAACPLEHALELLYAADMLFLDTLKTKAAIAISTLGSGRRSALVDRTHGGAEQGNSSNGTSSARQQQNGSATKSTPPPLIRANTSAATVVEDEEEAEEEPINIYDVIHAAWDLRVQRLEEFAARYLAQRLEDYIDDPEFHELIRESAHRIQRREETDTIELLDDIRYYLSERFRLRFEDADLHDILGDDGEISPEAVAALVKEQEEGAQKQAATAAAAAVANGDGIPLVSDQAPPTTATTTTTTTTMEHLRTLDGEAVEDEFLADAVNYQVLLGKIDSMLERLNLDA